MSHASNRRAIEFHVPRVISGFPRSSTPRRCPGCLSPTVTTLSIAATYAQSSSSEKLSQRMGSPVQAAEGSPLSDAWSETALAEEAPPAWGVPVAPGAR